MHLFQASIVKVLETETTVMLLALDLKLLFECPPPLLVLNELFKNQAVHHFTVEAFSHIDLDAIDLRRVWVNHFVTVAREVALCKDNFSLELLAMMAELKYSSLVSVLDLKLLKFF